MGFLSKIEAKTANIGIIKHLENRMGFIETPAPDHQKIFFHLNSCLAPTDLKVGDEVTFQRVPGSGIPKAKRIERKEQK